MPIFNTILSGVTNPILQGEDGDFYINVSTEFIFGPKAGGVWGGGVSLRGGIGPQGHDGATNTILSGITNPIEQGDDGDFYLNYSTMTMFGPKATVWGSGVNLRGPIGLQGSQGIQGPAGSGSGGGDTLLLNNFPLSTTDAIFLINGA